MDQIGMSTMRRENIRAYYIARLWLVFMNIGYYVILVYNLA